MDDRYRDVGATLFGRPLRLAVASWVLDNEYFFQGQAADGVGYQATAVRAELDRLDHLGMLITHPVTSDGRRQYFTRVSDHPLWKVVEAARDYVLNPQPSH